MLIQRLGCENQCKPEYIDEFLSVVRRHPRCCDEVWLSSLYGFPPLNVHASSAQAMGTAAERFREAGIRVSLQISNTIGHGEYMKAMDCSGLVYAGSPAEKLMGPDETVAEYCFCWNGEYFRRYTVSAVRQYVEQVRPWAVWLDDDLRATNHFPVPYGCFCPSCMDRFNREYDTDFTRESLVSAIQSALVWRERFVDFLRQSLGSFAFLLAKTVLEVCPDIRLGYQHGAYGGYTGYGLEYIFDALRRAGCPHPMSRSGGGAYADHDPNALIEKMFSISWQNRMLPDYVTEHCPEIENLPDVVFGKTIGGTCLESCLYLAGGNTSLSYAMLMEAYEPLRWHEQALEQFALHRPYWDRLAANNRNTRPAGVVMLLHESLWKARHELSKPNFYWVEEPFLHIAPWARMAIPLTYDSSGDSPVFLLHEAVAATLPGEQIVGLLNKPVITSGAALEILAQRGYGHCFGTAVKPVNTSYFKELFLPHPINGDAAGNHWAQFLSYSQGHYLLDRDGTTEPFAVYLPINNALTPDRKRVANAIVKTQQGGQWAVFGHTPWNPVISLDKRNQLLRAVDYISGNRLPVILESPNQAILLPRENENGRTVSVSVVNCTIENSGALELVIRRPAGTSAVFMSDCERVPLSHQLYGQDSWKVCIPSLHPWGVGTIFIENE